MSQYHPTDQPPPPSQPVYMMYPQEPDDSIDLFELLNALWVRKWTIMGVTIAFATAGLAYALLATPVFRTEVVLATTQSERGTSLPAGLSGLAGLAGVNFGAPKDTAQSLATLRSRIFVEEFIVDNDLLPVLFADDWDSENGKWIADDPEDWPDIQDGVQYFIDSVRTVDEQADTGLITLAVKWKDPEIAATWAEQLVVRINERLRARDLADSERRLEYLNEQFEKVGLVEMRQAISRLIEEQLKTIMLAQVDSEYAFKVIDPPRVSNERVSPRPLLILVLAIFVGGIIGCVGVLLQLGWSSKTAAITPEPNH